jgi:hypothetical protein
MTTPDSSAPLASVPPALDVCASRLLALTRTEFPDPGTTLHLLHAVDRLRAAGARPVPIALAPRPPDAVIRDVLSELAVLPSAVFAHPSIADAAAAVRRVLTLATPTSAAP